MIFSVIVPFLNEEKYIGQCIASLREQDFDKSEYELIFIDNGSTDRSARMVGRFPEIRLIQENQGNSYTARNKGVSLARGEILAFTDADCAAAPDWLTQIYRGLNETKAALVLGRRYFHPQKSWWLKMCEDYENAKIEYVLRNCGKKYFYAYTNNFAVTANLFHKIGFIEGLLRAEDTGFVQKCITRYSDLKVEYLPEMQVTHLEITRVKDWLRKIKIYQQSNLLIAEKTGFTPLDLVRRFAIYRKVIKQNRYPLVKALLFLFLLIWGNFTIKMVKT